MNKKAVKLGSFVYHKAIYNGKELMEIVGIRNDEIELKGDYSGGTHCITQACWMPVDGIIDPERTMLNDDFEKFIQWVADNCTIEDDTIDTDGGNRSIPIRYFAYEGYGPKTAEQLYELFKH